MARVLALLCPFLGSALLAQVPNLVSYQGRVAVGTVNFDGPGQFKFALVDSTGTNTFWSNDGTSVAGAPTTTAVSLTVTKGLYSLLLGDTSLANMTAIPTSVWTNTDVRLRIWFNDGTHGFQLLTPDRRLAPNGYLPDGSVAAAKIAAGAVGSTQLAPSAVQSANIAAGAVGTTQLASGVTVPTTTKINNHPLSADIALTAPDVGAAPAALSINAQTGASYTLALGDAGQLVAMSSAAANTLTVPSNSSAAFPIGTQILIEQGGAGTTTIAAGPGVTIRNPAAVYTIGAQYGVASLVKLATDIWLAAGDFGPLGFTGPTITGTTTSGSPQIVAQYSGTKYLGLLVDSNGEANLNLVSDAGVPVLAWQLNGTNIFNILPDFLQINGAATRIGFSDSASSHSLVRYDLAFGNGLCEGGAYPDVGMGIWNGSASTVTTLWELAKTTSNVPVVLTPQTAPKSPVEGMVYADSATHHLYFYNGTAWKQLDN